MPEELLLIICQEDNDEIVEKERGLYLCDRRERNGEGPGDVNVNEHNRQGLNNNLNGESQDVC